MIRLSIDTSAGTSAALVDGQDIVRAESVDDVRRHAEVIATLIAAVVADARVDEVVVGQGPGPFTGLRVGIAAAQGYAIGAAVPLIGVHSHDAIGCPTSAPTVVTTDVRRRERAWSLYEHGACVIGPRLAPADAVQDAVRSAGLDVAGLDWIDATWVPAAELAIALDAGRAHRVDTAVYLRDADATPPGAPKRVS